MGTNIVQTQFSASDYSRFQARLEQNLKALKQLLDRPGFGKGPPSIGSELELYLLDERNRPLHRNTEIQQRCADPLLTLELNRFNLEYNLQPVPAAGRPFSAIEQQMSTSLDTINDAAQEFKGKAIPIGILPTLRRKDFGSHAMTDLPRYHVLTQALQKMRGEMFAIRIDGEEPISLRAKDVTFEGACTSMQVHLRVNPDEFAHYYNAVQMLTPVMVAVSTNSPFFMGRRLWQETRIPLFKLAIDGRNPDRRNIHLPSRVDFGSGWVRKNAYELFAETVHVHEALVPISSRVNPLNRLVAGEIPELTELRLHQGTTWRWNRPVFDPANGGHLRIEMRALPAGPTVIDMVANMAFAIGTAVGIKNQVETLIAAMPFQTCSHNFYRCAQFGLDTQLMWPDAGSLALRQQSVRELALDLLPIARRGLRELGVSSSEIKRYLRIIEHRLDRKKTGAGWQLMYYQRLNQKMPRNTALNKMVGQYARLSQQNIPLVDWPEKA